ncbi:M48 family metalloprotease [Nocardia sp. NPDC049149]|uniref:M48 family metalloprotease n=1 Tax=Nocardia sp. NPDC049149 TaxID=3364315 RepID=UPI00371EB9A3
MSTTPRRLASGINAEPADDRSVSTPPNRTRTEWSDSEFWVVAVFSNPDRVPRRDTDWARWTWRRWVWSVVALVASSPRTVLTAVLQAALGSALGLPAAALPAVWLLCCAAYYSVALVRATAPWAYGIRRPNEAEQVALTAAWAAVASAAGFDGSRYSLWVLDDSALNAFIAPRRLVGVTTGALQRLKPRRLEAVLAHEYGHRLVGLGQVAKFSALFATPVSSVLGYLFGAIRIVADPLARISVWLSAPLSWVWLVGMSIAVPAALTPILGLSWAVTLAIPCYVQPLVTKLLELRSEFLADRVAVDLGYGGELVAFYTFMETFTPDGYPAGAHQIPKPSAELRIDCVRRRMKVLQRSDRVDSWLHEQTGRHT